MDQGLDVKRLREDFPALQRPGANGRLPIYFDNAAGTIPPTAGDRGHHRILSSNTRPVLGVHAMRGPTRSKAKSTRRASPSPA